LLARGRQGLETGATVVLVVVKVVEVVDMVVVENVVICFIVSSRALNHSVYSLQILTVEDVVVLVRAVVKDVAVDVGSGPTVA
jgi:hypothetical protein